MHKNATAESKVPKTISATPTDLVLRGQMKWSADEAARKRGETKTENLLVIYEGVPSYVAEWFAGTPEGRNIGFRTHGSCRITAQSSLRDGKAERNSQGSVILRPMAVKGGNPEKAEKKRKLELLRDAGCASGDSPDEVRQKVLRHMGLADL